MNLMHWRLLVAVADLSSVSKAAERCGITQSGASQAIAQMEETLGLQLLVRDRRETTPTAIGGQIVARARAMLRELEGIRELAGQSKSLRGRLAVASFPSVFASLLPAFLRSFARLHPEIDVIPLEGTDEEVEAWLAAGAVDIGVLLNPAPVRAAMMLGRDAWVAVVPERHPFAQRPRDAKLGLAELAKEPFVLATGGCRSHGRLLIEDAGLALTDIRITVRDWPTAFALIRDGMGVSLVPESTLPDDRQGMRVIALECPHYREFGLVCSSAGSESKPAQAFLDLIKKSPAFGY